MIERRGKENSDQVREEEIMRKHKHNDRMKVGGRCDKDNGGRGKTKKILRGKPQLCYFSIFNTVGTVAA